ncbi:MAG: bifunctional diaminohydroxyphosphoribosylaminopyrimidine deaminase/5-amino-6-(5-phosphoribosylamino)uracil reductase RibD [Candidatus Devosia symbiotica]|nr:bifunctional diaminohydroxyphosphoribosylaminopyrimidine deaminase/5-amino-6-(5-phosphoribosylamino)uracil reductase RibD [Candidatus Devosia symbiotica]
MTEVSAEDLRWLDAAARYATPFLGTTGDNPCAAALVVDPLNQTLIARAVTARGGRPHSEALALESAGFGAAGATLYVTLEPCYHWGRTPPCVDAIVRSGVMRVVIGVADPDPHTAEVSVERLRSAGVEVVLAEHAASAVLHAGHLRHRNNARPYVAAMLAVSLDDRIVSPVSGMARDWLDLQRARSNAILIGAATAHHHNHQLVVAIPGLASRTPLRIVLAGAQGVDRSLNLVGGFSGYRTAIIAENDAPVDAPVSVEVLRVKGSGGRPDLAESLTLLARKGIQNLLVEPGPRLMTALLEVGLIDCFSLITAGAAAPDAPPASQSGTVADLLAAAGLVEVEKQDRNTDTLRLYRRPA